MFQNEALNVNHIVAFKFCSTFNVEQSFYNSGLFQNNTGHWLSPRFKNVLQSTIAFAIKTFYYKCFMYPNHW